MLIGIICHVYRGFVKYIMANIFLFTRIDNRYDVIIVVINPLLVYHLFFSDFKDEVKDFLVSKVCSFTGLKYTRRVSGAG